MMCRYVQVFCLVLLSGLLGGCGTFSPVKVPQVSTYTMAGMKTNLSEKEGRRGTLLMTAPTALSGYSSSKMIYVQVPFKLRSFAHNRWVAPPVKLLMPIIANQLRAAGLFHAVVMPPFSGESQYQLSVQLLMLQQEFLQPTSRVHLKVRATLLSGMNGKVLVARVFDILEPSPDNNPYGGVLATNKAASKLSLKIVRMVRKYLPRHRK